MKVILFKPKGTSDSITPVLGLGYLASSIENRHDVTIVHGIRERIDPHRFKRKLEQLRPELVGFQVYTHDLATLPSYLHVLRKTVPDAWVVLGGPHPTAVPGTSLRLFEGLKGFVIRGEAEGSFAMLLTVLSQSDSMPEGSDACELQRIHGLVWEEDGKITKNQIHWIQDLDTIPFPAWHLIKPQKFPPSPHAAFYKRFPVAPMIASRGCPYPCVYCAGRLTMGKKVRYRSVENVLEEVQLLLSGYGVKEIHFVDDNFTHSKEYVLRFCEETRKKGLDFSWTCPNGVRLNTIDEETLRSMKDAGCYSVAVGIESGSQRLLNDMKKDLKIEEIRFKVDLISRAGLTPIGFFILGLPTETREEMKQTLQLSRSLALKRANFMLFHPFPGTEAFEWIHRRKHRNGVLLTAPSYAEVSYVPEGFTMKELKAWQRKAFLGFYLRPAVLWGLLRDIRSFSHGYYVFRRVIRWMVGDLFKGR